MAQALLGGLGPLQIRAMQEQQLAQYLAPKGGGRILAAGSPGAGRDMGSQIGSGLAGLGAGLEKLGAYMEKNKAKEEQAAAIEKQRAMVAKWSETLPAADRMRIDAIASTPEGLSMVAAKLTEQVFPKPGEGFSLKPGEERFNAKGDRIAGVPAAPKDYGVETFYKPGTNEVRSIVASPQNLDVMVRSGWVKGKPEKLTPGVDVPYPQEVVQQKSQIAAAGRTSPQQAAELKTAELEAEASFDKKTNFPRARSAFEKVNQKTDYLTNLINKTVSQIDQYSTGWGGMILSKIPGTPAADMRRNLDTIAANLMFSELTDLKNASPNGASGMGALSEREGLLLQSVQGSLEPNQSADQLKRNLLQILNNVRGTRDAAESVFVSSYGDMLPQKPKTQEASESTTADPMKIDPFNASDEEINRAFDEMQRKLRAN